MKFSYFYRTEMISQLKNQMFDVLVIGGGITGAGIALDAASRGMKTALVEMQDFSSGTSSRSTKLVHGGLRYLKQLEVKMVSEVGKERAIVYHNGPHVTKPEWILLPLHTGGTFGKFSTSFGLRIYDFLAGVKKYERRKMLTIEEVLHHEPLLKKEGLKGGGYYVEYRTDDARLTIEVMKSAFDQGAIALNYTKLESFIYENGIVIGGFVKDQLSEELYEIRASEVVNAAGPWVDSIRDMDKSKKGKVLKLSKGVHIVIDHSRFPLKQAIYFDTHDGRMVFAIPRDGKAYVGTTDTFYDEDVSCSSITISDQNYLIHAINEMFPTVEITKSDIESSWAGVRPLIFEEGKNPSEISRKDEIWESESGLITIAGGKLTGYRKMAETVVDLLSKKLSKQMNKTYPSSRTKELPISGGDVGGPENFDVFISQQVDKGKKLGFKKEEAIQLVEKYGSNVSFLFEFISDSKKIAESNDLPLPVVAKLLYAIHYEMTVDPIDFFLRRTGDLLFDIKIVILYKNKIVSLMANLFHWDKNMEKYYLMKLEREIKLATVPIES